MVDGFRRYKDSRRLYCEQYRECQKCGKVELRLTDARNTG